LSSTQAVAGAELRRQVSDGAWAIRRAWRACPGLLVRLFVSVMVRGLLPAGTALALKELIGGTQGVTVPGA